MLYTVKVTKSAGGSSNSKKWSNVYHIKTPETLDSAKIPIYVQQLVDIEKATHLNDTVFVGALVSTVTKEGKGHPETRRRIPVSGNGTVDVGASGAYALQAVLKVQLSSTLGSGGMKYYRNCLTEAMITTAQGISTITGGLGPGPQNAWNQYFEIADKPDLVILLEGSDDESKATVVTSATVQNIAFRSLTRRKKKK